MVFKLQREFIWRMDLLWISVKCLYPVQKKVLSHLTRVAVGSRPILHLFIE